MTSSGQSVDLKRQMQAITSAELNHKQCPSRQVGSWHGPTFRRAAPILLQLRDKQSCPRDACLVSGDPEQTFARHSKVHGANASQGWVYRAAGAAVTLASH